MASTVLHQSGSLSSRAALFSGQEIGGILADGFEEREAHGRAAIAQAVNDDIGGDERQVAQNRQMIEGAVRTRDGFGGGYRPAAAKDAEGSEYLA